MAYIHFCLTQHHIDHKYDKNVNFVKKEDNLANLSEISLIEGFWGMLKGKVYVHNWQVIKSLENLAIILYMTFLNQLWAGPIIFAQMVFLKNVDVANKESI